MRRYVAVGVIGLLCCVRGPAADVENGIYAVKDSDEARTVALSGGKRGTLGPRLGPIPAEATVVSTANDNSRFIVNLKNVGPPKSVAGFSQAVAVVDGVFMAHFGNTEWPDGRRDLSFTVQGLESARKVAAALKVEPKLRTIPNYRIDVRWTPDKEEYRVGEPVTLTMVLRNVGATTLAYRNGGQQRGPRNNQFHFVARHAAGQGPSVPDTGDPFHMGGISSVLTLRPGESMTWTVPLDRWFKFTEPDTYRITGSFELELYDPANHVPSGHEDRIWDDQATGECLIRVVADKK